MTRAFIIMLVVVGLVLGGIFGWKAFTGYQMQKAMASMAMPATTVSTAEVRAASWRPTIPAIGSLRALQGVNVTVQLAGQITALHFESGMAVSEGDLLVRQYTAADEARLRGLVADTQLAATNFKRAEELIDRDLVSDTEYDTRRAELQRARAAEESLRLVIAQKSILAPFTGKLGIRQVDVGQYVEPGDTLVRLEAFDKMLVEFPLPQRYLGQVSMGQIIEVATDAWPGEVFAGVVRAIEPQVDKDTRTVRVQGIVANPDERLVPGMFAEVGLALPQELAVVTVPQAAITYSPYGDAVYVVESTPEGVLVARNTTVVVGATRGDQVAVLEGLEAGATVVTAGQQKLRNGSAVRIDNSVAISDDATPVPANN